MEGPCSWERTSGVSAPVGSRQAGAEVPRVPSGESREQAARPRLRSRFLDGSRDRLRRTGSWSMAGARPLGLSRARTPPEAEQMPSPKQPQLAGLPAPPVSTQPRPEPGKAWKEAPVGEAAGHQVLAVAPEPPLALGGP